MAKKSTPVATQFAVQSIIQADGWIGVWFDADEDGHDRDSVMKEPVVCWALATWQAGRSKKSGAVGLIAGYPELYAPELLEDNFRGYCKMNKDSLDEFLDNWDNAHVEGDPDDDETETESEEDDPSDEDDPSEDEEDEED